MLENTSRAILPGIYLRETFSHVQQKGEVSQMPVSDIEVKENRRFIISFPDLGVRYLGVLPGEDFVDYYIDGNQCINQIFLNEDGEKYLGQFTEFHIQKDSKPGVMLDQLKQAIYTRMVELQQR